MNVITPLLVFHICAATIGLLSGFLSMLFRKGSGLHRAAGNVFFVSMLCMSSSATVIAWRKPVMISVVVGLLVFYLVITAWMAARRRDGQTSIYDVVAMLPGLAAGAAGLRFGVDGANGFPPGMFIFFGSASLLFVFSDVRMVLRGGVSGAKRIARHLWRMCFALLLATLSFYPGNARLFSPELRKSGVLWLPLLFVAVMTIYWMIRVRRSNGARKNDPHPTPSGQERPEHQQGEVRHRGRGDAVGLA